MKLHQISVFLENKPGQVRNACQLISEAGINVLTLSLADSKQFGIMRIIVREWEQAKQLLEQNGWVVKVTEVLAIEVADQPGGLTEILTALEREDLNLEYLYAFTFGRANRAVLIFRFEDPDRAIAMLQSQGISVIDPVELYTRVDEKKNE
jgi:hypothetical protein